jgi:hypothetical protein
MYTNEKHEVGWAENKAFSRKVDVVRLTSQDILNQPKMTKYQGNTGGANGGTSGKLL